MGGYNSGYTVCVDVGRHLRLDWMCGNFFQDRSLTGLLSRGFSFLSHGYLKAASVSLWYGNWHLPEWAISERVRRRPQGPSWLGLWRWYHYFCFILFRRNESLNLTHTPREWGWRDCFTEFMDVFYKHHRVYSRHGILLCVLSYNLLFSLNKTPWRPFHISTYRIASFSLSKDISL